MHDFLCKAVQHYVVSVGRFADFTDFLVMGSWGFACGEDSDESAERIEHARSDWFLVRGADDGIKPGVKRSETPGTMVENIRSPRSGRQSNRQQVMFS